MQLFAVVVSRQSHIFKNFCCTVRIVLKQLEDEKTMLKSLIPIKEEKPRTFQVLLLDKDESEDVEVQEAEWIDFQRVEKHLVAGGSVFITSKNAQKIPLPRNKKPGLNTNKTRRVTAFYLNHV
jgi:hypothetical protein